MRPCHPFINGRTDRSLRYRGANHPKGALARTLAGLPDLGLLSAYADLYYGEMYEKQMEMAGKETARRRNRDAKENGGEWTEDQEEVHLLRLAAGLETWKPGEDTAATIAQLQSGTEFAMAGTDGGILNTQTWTQDSVLLAMNGNADAMLLPGMERDADATYSDALAQGLRDGLAVAAEQNRRAIAYVKNADGQWVGAEGTAMDISANADLLCGGNTGPVTGIGSTLLSNTTVPATGRSTYLETSLKQVTLGNYAEQVTAAGTAGQVILGLTGLDLPGDIRDIVYDITHWEWRGGHVTQTILDGIAFLPVVGALKYGDEVHVLLKGEADEIVRLTGKVQDEIGDAVLGGWERQIGHVLEQHVGQSDTDLLRRINDPREMISAASTFTDKQTAWNVITETINSHADEIAQWEKNAKPWGSIELPYNGVSNIGRGIQSGGNVIESMQNAIIRLKKLPQGGWVLQSAYPIS